MIKASVRIITYNHAPYIAQAIEGALMQETNFDYEILIGEDESDDGTREICIDYAEQYPDRVRVFLRSRDDVIYINGRPTGRYNSIETMKAARGEYIALCDGDDYWTDPHKLQKQVDYLEAHSECSICFHSVIEQYEDASRLQRVIGPPTKEDVDFNSWWRSHIYGGTYIATASIVFRRVDAPLPKWYSQLQFAGDWPLIVYLLIVVGGELGYLETNVPMAVYRKHSGGITTQGNSTTENRISMKTRDLHDHYLVMSQMDPQDRHSFREAIYKLHMNICTDYLVLGDNKQAVRHLAAAYRYPECLSYRKIIFSIKVLSLRYWPSIYPLLEKVKSHYDIRFRHVGCDRP